MSSQACPACGSRELHVFYRQERVPAHSCLLMDTVEEAMSFPRGSIELALCSECGFITNIAHDPSLQQYSSRYEETQGFSPHFSAWLRSLAERLIEKHDLRGKDVLEIGCGKGEFLALVCTLGGNRGVGIDPAYVEGRLDPKATANIEFITEYFSEAHSGLVGDVVACRHTLEHIGDVGDFMGLLRKVIGDKADTLVFFDLPDMLRVLHEGAFWDIYYEHCSYFTPGSLARLFRSTGFEVTDLGMEYDGQYIVIEAVPADGKEGERLELEETPEETRRAVEDFTRAFGAAREQWNGLLADYARDGRRVVVWGSGSKGVAFLTTLGIEDQVGLVVDVNPHKQGRFMAGTGHEIVAPGALVDYRPDAVIVMNPVYLDEIRRTLGDLGLEPELLAV